MRTFSRLLLLLLSFLVVNAGQVSQEQTLLEPDKPIEREIVGGQMHTYQINLKSGEFLRLLLCTEDADLILSLSEKGSTEIAKIRTYLSSVAPLSREITSSGIYLLTINFPDLRSGGRKYNLQLEKRNTPTVEDKKRVIAEKLLVESKHISLNEIRNSKLEQALVLWKEIEDRQLASYTLMLMAQFYLGRQTSPENKDTGNILNALELLSQSLAISSELNDPVGINQSLTQLGWAYSWHNQYEKEKEMYERLLTYHRMKGNRQGEAKALFRLGHCSDSIMPIDSLVEYCEQALAIFRKLNDHSQQDHTLIRLAQLYESQSHYEKALEAYEQSLTISRDFKTQNWSSLNSIGLLYLRLGNYQKAVEFLEESHSIKQNQAGPSLIDAVSYGNLARAFFDLGRTEKAIEYYEKELAVAREFKIYVFQSGALIGLADVWHRLGEPEKELQACEQALEIARKNNSPEWFKSELSRLGDFYYSQRNFGKAIEYYQSALSAARDCKCRSNEIHTLTKLGNVYRSLKAYRESIAYHEQALQFTREIKLRGDEAVVLSELLTTWIENKQPYLAIVYGKQSVNIYQDIRSDIRKLDAQSQQSYLKLKENTYRTLAGLLISQGRLPEAEQVIRMVKEEEYFEYVRRNENNSPKAEKASLTSEEVALEKRYRGIADRLSEIGTERSALLDKKSRTQEEKLRLALLDKDLAVAGRAFQKFLDGLANEFGKTKDSSARVADLIESQGLRADLRELGKGVVALHTLVGAEKYHVILTTADFQKGYEYSIKADDLNRKALAFREALQNPTLDPLPLAQELYRILLGPVAKDFEKLNARMLMWSLDGVLRYVPMAALHDGEKYLVERYRQAVFTPASNARLKDVPNHNWRVLGLGVTKAHGERIPALPGVLDEMRGIIREESDANARTGVLPGTIKLDEAFTEDSFLEGLRDGNPVVHIASHFQFQPGNETDSALLLGDGKFLSLAQIKVLPNVFSGVDLLTLSACNTATGGSGANGKEIEGFAVLAQRQGAKAVIASLWPVADRSTKDLMQEFYRLREAQTETTKAEALRQAQLKLLRGEGQAKTASAERGVVHLEDKNKPRYKTDPQKPYAHPYYWAPFILIGNWK